MRIMGKKDLKSHWDNTYGRADVEQLGWYEESPEPSLDLISKCNLLKNASILNVGAGATTLIDKLLDQGYENLIANDISSTAIDKLKERLGENESKRVKWITDDLTNPKELNNLKSIDLWHDRAVLHFFTEKKDQDTYFNLLREILNPGGFAIIATFNLSAETKCSGLPVFRYNKEMLQEKLGSDYELVESFNYTYIMPSENSREYIYTLFKRKTQ